MQQDIKHGGKYSMWEGGHSFWKEGLTVGYEKRPASLCADCKDWKKLRMQDDNRSIGFPDTISIGVCENKHNDHCGHVLNFSHECGYFK